MKLLLIAITALFISSRSVTAVTIDFSECPAAVSEIYFIGETVFANAYQQNGNIQTLYLPADEDYCIGFYINSPLCTVTTTYSHGEVTHYDPEHCGQTLLSGYSFTDVCD